MKPTGAIEKLPAVGCVRIPTSVPFRLSSALTAFASPAEDAAPSASRRMEVSSCFTVRVREFTCRWSLLISERAALSWYCRLFTAALVASASSMCPRG